MKKIYIITGTLINIVLTLVLADIFSLYHFFDVLTSLTIIYLLSIFIILEYLYLCLIYIIYKKKNKDKISIYKIGSLMMFFISIILVLGFIFLVDIDWLNYYSNFNSSPFYVFIICDFIKMIVPSIVVTLLGVFLLKKDINK